ncbi:rod shape-determining protein MreC [Aeromonas salmonicida subsp. pectinolytica 34mel]|uniref:Cell shape-determining protein MreC n=1 Tax=Aeromonas salmonicida subsp. salmonicida 01-B526 TaxID=1076135 RepID=A0ABP2MZ77_AERSS|nr:rod shape-determining protein MreC [Aeromonas salmonicida subsp. salmonicida 01-B526]EQC04361.1 rod shape-determining protein MreC [Aeromonas salmonicida subsp. pectinolytica 34mel]GAJ47597.1 rod shape-determining protein MreC [Aeromonas salmonicida subsp. masoucida NBRC 13784]
MFLAVIISIAAIVADSRFGVFTHVRVYLSSLVSPLQYIANAPGIMLDTMSTQVQTRAGLIEQTKQQEQQLFTLRSRLLKMDHLEHENQRLRELLGSPVHKESRKMVAELLSVDSDPFSHQVLINKGALDGVYNGQPVINDQGVIGQVLHVGSTTSRVLLVTDSSHGIPVRVLRNDLRAIASGSGELDKLELRNLPRNTDVQVGDLLVTSGLGGRFPEGYPVATVTRSDYVEGKPFAQVEAKPLVALDRLRYLLLLWTDKKPDVHDDDVAPAAPATSAAGATR